MVVGVDVEAIFQPRGVRAKQRHRKDGAASACCRQVGTRSWLLVRPQRLANFVVVLVAASSVATASAEDARYSLHRRGVLWAQQSLASMKISRRADVVKSDGPEKVGREPPREP